MRFDGYFLLSDLLDLQNLHERSGALARAFLRRQLLGWKEPDPEYFPRRLRTFLVCFALVAWVVRLFIFIAIALAVYHFFFKLAGIVLLAVELGWFVVRRLIYSPFGASLTGIRENVVRMHAIGSPAYARLVTAYVISGTIAGCAGALLMQTNQFVGLNVLSFEFAGELLVMLVLGGVGRIYGAFVGPLVYMIAQDQLAKQFPEYWYFGIGLLLVVVVLFARGGILGLIDSIVAKLRGVRP